jgi:hypothetical protein
VGRESVTKEKRVSSDLVLEMVSLVVNEYPTRVKMKKTVSMDTTTVEEVVDVEEDKGPSKTRKRRGGGAPEDVLEVGSPSVVGVTEGNVEGRRGVAGIEADGEQGDVEETGLKEVSGRDMRDMIILALEGDHSREVGGCGEELVLGVEAIKAGSLGVSYWAPMLQVGVPNQEELVWVRLVRVLGAQSTRKRVSSDRVLGNRRAILLVRVRCRFHWRRCRCRTAGRRGVWMRRTSANT